MNSIKIKGIRTSLEGENQNGKSAFAYTAPFPIVGFAFDMGIERALFGGRFEFFKDLKIKIVEYEPKVKLDEHKALWRENDITIFKLPQPIQVDNVKVKGMKELWDYFNVRISAAIADDYVRSDVVDTMTLARRVKADAYLQQLQEKSPGRERLIQIEYGTINDAVRDLYTSHEGAGKNLIAIHHLTDERKEVPIMKNGGVEIQQTLTGNRILEGLNNTYNYVDVALRLVGTADKMEFHVKAEFKKCGYVPELKGTYMEDPTWDSVMNWMNLKLGGRLEFPVRNEL